MTLIARVGIELEGDVEARARSVLLEIGVLQDDADDHIGLAAQRDRAADDGRVAPEPPHPERVIEQGDALAVRTVFLHRERPTPDDVDAEQAEEVGRDLRHPRLFRTSHVGEVHGVRAIRGHVLKDAGLLAVVRELRWRAGRSGALWRTGQRNHDPIRVGQRRRLQEDRVDDGEDRGIGANPEREGRDRGGGEAAVLKEHPERMFQVAQQVVHQSSCVSAVDRCG